MTTAIQFISLSVEYLGDIMLCIAAVAFASLVYMDDGLK